ncbi:hypothetical protein [Phreatobacter sp.]|uniref:hypothetical protein n=1 Tax=Phreatobacter sp. TaxID=1966341 RepID=UPI003F70DD04
MTDLHLACRRADRARADIIRQGLAALGVAVSADIETKAKGAAGRAAAAKIAREAIASARAVLVLWPDSILDPTENHGALIAEARQAHEAGKLVAARLGDIDTTQLEAPFDSLPAPDLGRWLADDNRRGDDPALLAMLGALGPLLDRPGLAEMAAAMEADRGKDGETAMMAFARRHPQDPVAVSLWERIEKSERERFAVEFRKAHGVLTERHQASEHRLRQTVEAFAVHLKALRAGEPSTVPDPKVAITDGMAALKDSVARLANDNARLETALARSEALRNAEETGRSKSPTLLIAASAAALILGSAAGAFVTEFAGPIRGEAHPRIAALSMLARERASVADASTGEVARLRTEARAAQRRAETAEANLRVARTHLAHAQTEVIQRQGQAGEATGQVRRLQGELQTAREQAQTAQQQATALQQQAGAAQRRLQEAEARIAAVEAEAQGLRETQAAAAAPAPATPAAQPAPEVTGSIRRPQTAEPAAPAATEAPLPEPRPQGGDVTGSVPPPPPAAIDGPHRHRRDRWSFAPVPGFRLDSENDLPGPVNSVLVHESVPEAVIVVSANHAGRGGSCTPQDWYWENVMEGPRQRRGAMTQDAGLPANSGGFRGFSVRGRGVLHGERFRNDLDYYDLVAQRRNEPGVVYLVQARFPRGMATDMVRQVNEMWQSFEVTGPRAYPTRC